MKKKKNVSTLKENDMKVLVCISHVPDTTSKINFVENDTKFDTAGLHEASLMVFPFMVFAK